MIIAAFAATGKSYFCAENKGRAIDFVCMPFKYKNFSELSQGVDSEGIKAAYGLELRWGWEVEYSKAVIAIENANPNLYIFIPPVIRVLYLLKAAGIKYTIIYPEEKLLPEYIERCRERGNSEEFIDVLTTCWDSWINASKSNEWADRIQLSSGQYLTDVIRIGRDENQQ